MLSPPLTLDNLAKALHCELIAICLRKDDNGLLVTVQGVANSAVFIHHPVQGWQSGSNIHHPVRQHIAALSLLALFPSFAEVRDSDAVVLLMM